MKNPAIIWVIIAAVLVICGVVLFVIAGNSVDWDFKNFDMRKFETNTHELSENFESIVIDTADADITIVPSRDSLCRIECFEEADRKHTVAVKDGVLTVNGSTKEKLRELSFFNFKKAKITICLPQNEYEALDVKCRTGDISVSEELGFGSARIKATTGDVLWWADVENELDIKLTTGDTQLAAMAAGSIKIDITTGDIDARDITCKGEMSAVISTGDADFEAVSCKSFSAKGTTGDVRLNNVIAAGLLSAKCTTGDITLKRCDGGELFLKTTTGDVKGSLLSDKQFTADATTGDIKVPSTTGDGLCEVKTTTGDINISIE